MLTMPRKGMRSVFSTPSTTSSSTPPRSPSPLHPQSFSESLIQENMESAEAIIRKWDLNSTAFTRISFLFADSRKEAKHFLKAISDLQQAMHFYVSDRSFHPKLINAQNLMQIAIKRLEKELYHILSTNRDQLDPDSISGRTSHASDISRTSTSDFDDEIGSELEDDEIIPVAAAAAGVYTVAMSDLRLISECMISAGYGKECMRIYNIIRKSVVDEGLYRLGIEQITSNQVNKLDWEVLDLKIKNWVNVAKIAMKTYFTGERILCDYVFSSSDSIRESCFTEITRESANILFGFPEIIAKGKKSPEKMFRLLDLYDTISVLWPEIEAVFYFESTSIVRSQAISSLIKLGDAVRSMLTDFEAAIQKDSSKSAVPGGGIHPLTRYVMNYLCFLSDYSGILSDITADWPLPDQTSLPVSFDDDPDSDEFPTSAIAVRFAWLLLVLLCKLDGKTELFKDVSLSYLFLANNLHYVISKVSSSNLKFLLGEEWISKHEMKVKQYSTNYQRMGWSKVLSSLPGENIPSVQISVEQAKECFRRFSSAFETTYRKQSSWVMSDERLRDGIKMSLCNKIVPAYEEFYNIYRPALRNERHIDAIVRFTPEDVDNYLSDLFSGKGASDSSSRGSHSV